MKDPLISAGMVLAAYAIIMVLVCAMMGLADQRQVVQRPRRRAALRWLMYGAAMAVAVVASIVCPMGFAPGYAP